MHQEHAMPFKSFVSILMELLEDADGMVRDVARNTVIELFQFVPSSCTHSNPLTIDVETHPTLQNLI